MIELQNIKSPILQILLVGMLTLLVTLALSPGAAAADEQVRIVVEGKELQPPVPPQIVEGRTVVPIRVVGEALGARVDWDGEKRQVTITRRNEFVVLTIDKAEALVNGRPVTLDVPATIIDDRTMVPLRFVGEAFGDTVQWDGETRTVSIHRRVSRIIGMNLVKEVGQAHIDLVLSEPLTEWQQRQQGNSILLDLYPAVIEVPDPVRLLGDPLVRGLVLRPGEIDRSGRLAIDLWRTPRYRVTTNAEGTTIRISIEYDVTGIEYKLDGLIPTVLIAGNGPLNYATHAIRDPDRIVVDIAGAPPTEDVPETLPVGHRLIKQVRSSHFTKEPAHSTRVVLDLNQAHAYEVVRTEAGLLVKLVPQLSGITVDKLPGRTRLTLAGSTPFEGTVRFDAPTQTLLVQMPQTKSALPNPSITVGDGAIDTVVVGPGTAPDSLLVTIGLPYYLGHQVTSKPGDTNLVIELITSPILGKRIWIDAGHGGNDGGAAGATAGPGLEKLVNLQLALEVQRQLQEAGATVLMSRTTDTLVSLQEISRLTNAAKPDVFISIHHNSTDSRAGVARGAETYYFTPQSKMLADFVHAAFIEGTDQPDRKVKQGNYYVIRETQVPAILVEVGFLDNIIDEQLARDPAFQKRSATAIRQGLFNYFSQLLTPGQPR